uniref:Anoctamin n=2 Tax=Latimeria chalumnae TaxID=7897 RepID=H2ZSH6_LATCH
VIVLQLSSRTKMNTINWLISRIQEEKLLGGAELLCKLAYVSHKDGVILLIGGTLERLLHGAEEKELVKQYKDGTLKPFLYHDRNNFHDFKNKKQLFLTSGECLQLIKHDLDNLRARQEKHVPEVPYAKLYPGKNILNTLATSGLLVQMYPLHNFEELETLKEVWYGKVQVFSQPINAVRNYFGESIALYFSFLGFFTLSLFYRSIFSLILYFLTDKTFNGNMLMAIINIVWSTIFLECWKRKSNKMAFQWGMLHRVEEFEEPRKGFEGPLGINPVTGKKEPIRLPGEWRSLNFIHSFLFVSFSLLVSVLMMLAYLWAKTLAEKYCAIHRNTQSYVIAVLPNVGYAIGVIILNRTYLKLARVFTEWENHRLASTHEYHLVAKLLLFYFFNNFGLLFYAAFYMQDFTEVSEDVATQLITYQILDQIMKSIVPYWINKRKLKKLKQSSETRGGPVLQHVLIEGGLDAYKGLIDDYLEMFLMFGYMMFFSSIFPLASVCCFLNSITEIQLSALKLCDNFQRPFPVPASNIGIWQLAFKCFVILAIIVNCAFLGMSAEFQAVFGDYTGIHLIILVFTFEHLIMGFVTLIEHLIPDVPKNIEIQLKKFEYESRQALKCEKLQQTYIKDNQKLFSSAQRRERQI